MKGVDDPKTQEKVHEAVLGLKPDEADRLMYVGNLQGTCEFARPSPKTIYRNRSSIKKEGSRSHQTGPVDL
jgi:hypothetical protein